MEKYPVESIVERRFVTADLVRRFPAQLENQNKAIVFALALPRDALHGGEIVFSRWRSPGLPSGQVGTGKRPQWEVRADFFTYDHPPPGQVDWHLNFAHCDLFRFYGGPLFAQDEMQVTEHPALASLRHALVYEKIRVVTVENDVPTPALVMGVERRCDVATDPDPSAGRPYGLYGNAFARASEDAIRRATRLLEPPTTSNILGMEAPSYGRGRYSSNDLEYILLTACTGFAAAVEASRRANPNAQTVVIHTGYWGCGAYGGNRIVMVACQLAAACCAGVDRLVFHAGPDVDSYDDAVALFDELCPSGAPIDLAKFIAAIEGRGFRWGISDGN